MLTRELILSKTDHTLLKPEAKEADVLALCEDARRFKTASVCIPPRFVNVAARFLADAIPVCTVVGFPLGYQTTKAKCAETEEALASGALEIDTVIPIGAVKDENYKLIFDELVALKKISGTHTLKVIIETCLLTDPEKRMLTKLIAESGADFIKTSTGFSKAGAAVADIRQFKETCPDL